MFEGIDLCLGDSVPRDARRMICLDTVRSGLAEAVTGRRAVSVLSDRTSELSIGERSVVTLARRPGRTIEALAVHAGLPRPMRSVVSFAQWVAPVLGGAPDLSLAAIQPGDIVYNAGVEAWWHRTARRRDYCSIAEAFLDSLLAPGGTIARRSHTESLWLVVGGDGVFWGVGLHDEYLRISGVSVQTFDPSQIPNRTLQFTGHALRRAYGRLRLSGSESDITTALLRALKNAPRRFSGRIGPMGYTCVTVPGIGDVTTVFDFSCTDPLRPYPTLMTVYRTEIVSMPEFLRIALTSMGRGEPLPVASGGGV